MKVALHPSDGTGCGVYRCVYPAMAAQAAGVQVELVNERAPVVFVEHEGGIGARARDPEADVVVLQRVVSRRIAELIPILQDLGHAVVVDIDDDFSCLPANHPAFQQFSPTNAPDKNFQYLKRACAMADLVTVPSRTLAERFGSHGRVAVLPNCVPARLLDMPRIADGNTVGWSGWAAVHPGDLAVTHGGVQQALERTGWGFGVVGPGEGVARELGLTQEPVATGGLPLEGYYRALGHLTVGICPLADIRFNSGKGHKGLELAARGVPFVASPVGHYPDLAAQGVGLLVSPRARNWRAALELLIGDEGYRAEMAETGRQVVAEHHTYEGNGHRWAEAWETALTNYKQRSGGGGSIAHTAAAIGTSA